MVQTCVYCGFLSVNSAAIIMRVIKLMDDNQCQMTMPIKKIDMVNLKEMLPGGNWAVFITAGQAGHSIDFDNYELARESYLKIIEAIEHCWI